MDPIRLIEGLLDLLRKEREAVKEMIASGAQDWAHYQYLRGRYETTDLVTSYVQEYLKKAERDDTED